MKPAQQFLIAVIPTTNFDPPPEGTGEPDHVEAIPHTVAIPESAI